MSVSILSPYFLTSSTTIFVIFVCGLGMYQGRFMESFRKVRSQRKNVHSCTIFWGSRSDPLGECRIKKGLLLEKKTLSVRFTQQFPDCV